MGALQKFGSSGIRGPTEHVDTALGLRLGRALGATFRDVVVGRDARRTGPALEAALVAGLLASGADVTRAGVLPTPALAHLARHHTLGIQVTASHNPAPDNGYKLWTPEGGSPEEPVLVAIEAAMDDPPAHADWTTTGRETWLHSASDAYRAAIRERLARDGFSRHPLRDLRIALDCAHGAGALATPAILSELGASLTVLGGTPDGRFPDHPSEPTAEHLRNLRALMATGAFHLGIAHDGDADRTVFLAPDGTLIAPERLLAVLARLRGDAQIALPVDASGVVADHCPDARITITPVGDIHLSRAITAGRATAACEPSGTWFFADWSPTPEGPYAAAYVACLVARHPDLLQRVAALPAYARATRKMPLPRGLSRADARQRVRLAGDALAAAVDATRTSDVDGLRIETGDGWVLVRPSGTEPVVRATAEARESARAQHLVDQAQAALHRVLEAA